MKMNQVDQGGADKAWLGLIKKKPTGPVLGAAWKMACKRYRPDEDVQGWHDKWVKQVKEFAHRVSGKGENPLLVMSAVIEHWDDFRALVEKSTGQPVHAEKPQAYLLRHHRDEALMIFRRSVVEEDGASGGPKYFGPGEWE